MHHQYDKMFAHTMSKKTAIYVLFKEYNDPYGRKKSAPYIQYSTDYLANPDAMMQDWSEVFEVLEYFNYEDANKYYDEDNFEGLIGVARTLSNEYPSVETIINAQLQTIGLTSWRTTSLVKSSSYQLGMDDVTNDMLGDMVQREVEHRNVLVSIKNDTQHQLLPHQKEFEPCVLLQTGAVRTVNGDLKIRLHPSGREITLKTVSGIAGLHDWLSKHRFPTRHYKYNPKHGDAHNLSGWIYEKNKPKVRAAQLKTTTGKTKALLMKAVGDNIGGSLWYYDDANQSYIFFEKPAKNPQNEYHGYHLNRGDKGYDRIGFEKLKVVQPHIKY